jgi:hypothetical protein
MPTVEQLEQQLRKMFYELPLSLVSAHPEKTIVQLIEERHEHAMQMLIAALRESGSI